MRPLLPPKSDSVILPTHDGEHHTRSNAVAVKNTAESKNKKRKEKEKEKEKERERGTKRREVRNGVGGDESLTF